MNKHATFSYFIATLIIVSQPVLAEKQLDNLHPVKAIVEQMRGISMNLSASARSDGHTDPLENKKKKILAELRASGQDVIPLLVGALKDKDVQMRRNACLALTELGGTWTANPRVDTSDALPALIEATKDSDGAVRAWATHAIAEIGPAAETAVPALIELLNDPDEGARNNSAMALGSIGPEARAAIPALRKALTDPKPDVRRFARRALEQITKKL